MAITFTTAQLNAFRREAKKLKRDLSITYLSALDSIARRHGFANWSLLAKHSSDKTEIAPHVDAPARSFGHRSASIARDCPQSAGVDGGFNVGGPRPRRGPRREYLCLPSFSLQSIRRSMVQAFQETGTVPRIEFAMAFTWLLGIRLEDAKKLVDSEVHALLADGAERSGGVYFKDVDHNATTSFALIHFPRRPVKRRDSR